MCTPVQVVHVLATSAIVNCVKRVEEVRYEGIVRKDTELWATFCGHLGAQESPQKPRATSPFLHLGCLHFLQILYSNTLQVYSSIETKV